jgi:hypothetical protein
LVAVAASCLNLNLRAGRDVSIGFCGTDGAGVAESRVLAGPISGGVALCGVALCGVALGGVALGGVVLRGVALGGCALGGGGAS